MDSLNFGGESLVELLNDDSFEFMRGDVRDEADVQKAVDGADAVVHLASIVGDPACAKEPDVAQSTNVDGGKLLYRKCVEANVGRFVFASTCSNYGKMKDGEFVDETSDLNPISLYAETKVEFEKFLDAESSDTCAPTTCRFSTVYGLSPRPRFDLTVNEFTRDVAVGRELCIFGQQFWRPYCHVVDLARSAITMLEADTSKVRGNVFNVGDTRENYTKGMLVEEIGKQLPEMNVSFVEKDEDPRDYRVCSDKIAKELGFKITKTVPDGIRQIAKAVRDGFFADPFSSTYKNI
jgi:nucleoside-diphosphate-sugar epimerase